MKTMSKVEHGRERASEHILFCARVRSKVAKQKSDTLGDLPDRDVERFGRYPIALDDATW